MCASPLHNVANQNIQNPFEMGGGSDGSSLDVLRTNRIAVELFQNFFRACGFKRLENFFGQCRMGVLWTYHNYGVYKGTLRKTLTQNHSELINSPHNLSRFLNGCRDLSELISIPIGLALKNGLLPETLAPILENEYKNLVEQSFNLKLPEKNALLYSTFQQELNPGVSFNAKHKLIADKVNVVLEVAGIFFVKCQLNQLSLGLALASSIVKAYSFYLEKTDTPPIELFQSVKLQAEVIIKIQSAMIRMEVPEEKQEFIQEIHDEMLTHLNLISSSDNDAIYYDLENYKNSINQLFAIYEVTLEGFDIEMDQLLKASKPLVAHRENLEQSGAKLLQDHGVFLKQQLDKLQDSFGELQEKLNPADFNHFIKPEFEAAINMIKALRKQNEYDLAEFTLNPKFDITSFRILSVHEQKEMFDRVAKDTSAANQQEITALVKNICRQI